MVITKDPEIMSGAPCFSGTRVPVQTLFAYLEDGADLNEFLKDFGDSVSREMAVAALEEGKTAAFAALP
jgi:uncharacterized protein (DUF433 family)